MSRLSLRQLIPLARPPARPWPARPRRRRAAARASSKPRSAWTWNRSATATRRPSAPATVSARCRCSLSGAAFVGIDAIMAGLASHIAEREAQWSWVENYRVVDGCRSAYILYETVYAILRRGSPARAHGRRLHPSGRPLGRGLRPGHAAAGAVGWARFRAPPLAVTGLLALVAHRKVGMENVPTLREGTKRVRCAAHQASLSMPVMPRML